ncbi:MAG: tetratricopeptide repeat protein [Muribaculaceae bacterium]|nr:tetratricopeptide repeat protein [Muribaculaceae bacterium]
MKLNLILTAAVLAGSSFLSMAQTHQEGVEYYRADQFNNAKELLQRNYNNAGTDKAISEYYLGLIAIHDGNTAEAKEHFDKGISINASYPYNYVGLGELALKNGDKKAAEDYFKTAKSNVGKEKDDKASLDIAIARAYYNVDPTLYAKEIDKNVAQAMKDSPKEGPAATNVDIYLFDGDRKNDLKDFGGAGNQYEMATTYNPNATEAYVKYAELFTQVNPQYAINMLNKLLSVNPQSALGQRELANAYYNAQKYKEAATQYEKYVKNPNHFKQDEDRLAFLLFVDGDYQQGYDFATNLLKQNPQNFTAQRFQFMNAAQLDSMKDQLVPMAEALVVAHKANPANIFAPIDYNLISEELSNAGKADEAQALLEEAIAGDPSNRDYYKQLAMVFVKENNLPKATDAFQGYIDNTENPTYNDYIQQATYAFYAGVSNQKDNPDEANKYYDMAQASTEKAQQNNPSNFTKPLKIQGDIAKQRAPEEEVASAAVPLFTEGIAIFEAKENPSKNDINDAKEMYNYMGNYYLDQKDVPTAVTYFNKYLELDPENDAYRQFVEGLQK